MTLKVVHLVYSFGIGGLERVIVNLVNCSAKRDVEHHIVTLVDDHEFASQLNGNCHLHCLHKREGKDLHCHYRLLKLLKSIKPDVMHTYNFGTIEYHPIAFIEGVPIRVHADHGRESSYKKIDNPAKYEMFRKLMIPFITYYVVVSNDLQTWGKEKLGLDKKLRLVFNGIDLKQFEQTEQAPSQEKRPYTIVSVGRLVDVKNHQLLINAFSTALLQEPKLKQAQLLIVGDGPNRQMLEAQIKDLNLTDTVKLLGNRNDIPDILNTANVFVLSSKYEAMPMTALEAMACKLPVIAPDVGGVSFILENQDNGLLIKPESEEAMAEALVLAVNKTQKFEEMGMNGLQRVQKNFSVEAMTEAYFALYQKKN